MGIESINITTAEAAKLLGCSRAWVVDACERGIIGCSFKRDKKRVSRVSIGLLAKWRGVSEQEIVAKVKEMRNDTL